MAPSKPHVPEKLKQRLYPVVLDFFAENDFHQVNIRKISDVSGVSTGTIYKYFRSKEELILDILEEKIEELKPLTLTHLQGLESTREKFRKAFWVLMDYYDRNPGLAITFFITVPTRTWMQRESFARYDVHDIIAKIAAAGRQRHEIDPGLTDAQITGLYFMHSQREVTIWYYRGRQWKLVDTIDIFFPLFWKTVFA
jgi:TetR/AcrR family transcriptional regulator, fatty acid metabolism regulator protein